MDGLERRQGRFEVEKGLGVGTLNCPQARTVWANERGGWTAFLSWSASTRTSA